MDNQLIFNGILVHATGLLEDLRKDQTSYRYMEILVKADDGSGQSIHLKLTGELAVQLDSCDLRPTSELRLYLRLYAFDSVDQTTGSVMKCNSIRCWKIEVLDKKGESVFVCRK